MYIYIYMHVYAYINLSMYRYMFASQRMLAPFWMASISLSLCRLAFSFFFLAITSARLSVAQEYTASQKMHINKHTGSRACACVYACARTCACICV